MKSSRMLEKRLVHRESKRNEKRTVARTPSKKLSSGPTNTWIDIGIDSASWATIPWAESV